MSKKKTTSSNTTNKTAKKTSVVRSTKPATSKRSKSTNTRKKVSKKPVSVDAIINDFGRRRSTIETTLVNIEKKRVDFENKCRQMQNKIAEMQTQEADLKKELSGLDEARDKEVRQLLKSMGVNLDNDSNPKTAKKEDDNHPSLFDDDKKVSNEMKSSKESAETKS